MELAILGVLICQLSLSVLALVMVKKLIFSVIKNVRSFLEPISEGQLSPLATIGKTITGDIAQQISSALIASVKGWLMAQNSIAVRQDKAAAREELNASNPFLSVIAKYSPGIGKIMNKNPELAALAMNAFQNRGNKTISNNGGNGSGDFNKI